MEKKAREGFLMLMENVNNRLLEMQEEYGKHFIHMAPLQIVD